MRLVGIITVDGRDLSSSEDCSYHSVLVSRYGIARMCLGYLLGGSFLVDSRAVECGVTFGGGRRRNVGPGTPCALSLQSILGIRRF